MEIRTKKKWIAGKGIYGYPRQHNGNNNKKTKRIGSNGAFQPYDKRGTVLVLLPTMKTRFFHGEDAKAILGD